MRCTVLVSAALIILAGLASAADGPGKFTDVRSLRPRQHRLAQEDAGCQQTNLVKLHVVYPLCLCDWL